MRNRILFPALAALALAACGSDGGTPFEPPPVDTTTQPPPSDTARALPLLGTGAVSERWTSEVAVAGGYAYTGTWGGAFRTSGVTGNAIKIWNVAGAQPVLVDSIIVSGASTIGDVQVSDDGSLLVAATEYAPGSIVVYDRADPARPALLSRFSSASTEPGVHTVKLGRVNGRHYAFLSVDPGATPARLTIVDITDPASPKEVASRAMGSPYVHDVFVRDGVLFTALWNDGLSIWDIGGAGRGGSPENPVLLGNVKTVGGSVHNVWWYHDAQGNKRYAFVGEEGPGSVGGTRSEGDIHVVDVSDMAAPREIATFSVAGAGTHNFDVDEAKGILYAAYYNGGVRALDVTGDLAACTAEQRTTDGRCDLARMGRERGWGPRGLEKTYVWGVQLDGGRLYASDMWNGLLVLDPSVLGS